MSSTRHALTTSLAILCWAFCISSLHAQPSGFFKYKKLYESAERGSTEHLDNMFKAIDVIFHYDLDMALELANEATQVASEFGNSDAEAAGLMDQAVWTAYKYDSNRAQPFFDKAYEKFDENGNPRFLAHFYSARFGYSMINEEEEYDPNQFLEQERLIATELDDAHFMASYLYMAATSKVFVGKLPPTDKAILELRQRLAKLSAENNFETGKLNLMLLEAQEAALAENYLGAMMTLNRTIEFAKEKQYRLFEVRGQMYFAALEKEQAYGKYIEQHGPLEELSESQVKELKARMEPVCKRYQECLKVARQVKMSAYIFESLINSAFVEFHCGNVETAKLLIAEAVELPYECFRSWVLRDTLYRHAIMIYASDGDVEKVKKYAAMLDSPEHIARANDAEAKSTRYRQQLTAVKQEKASAETESELIQNTLVNERRDAVQQVGRLQNVILYSAILLGLTGLLGALFWNRGRLKIVEKELTTEKETSRATREMRDILQERVNRMQRMESLGMLAGGVAHDFNNLLVGVMCNAELLEVQNENLDEFSQHRVSQIMASAEKAADLSRQMLAYAGKQQIQKQPHDINEILVDMTRVLNVSVGEQQKLTIELGKEQVVADIDSTQIEQILLNLVNNSSYVSSEDGGEIVIRTGREKIETIHGDANLFGTRETGGDFVYFEVEDFGSGFQDAELARIFEPFYSVKEQGRGLGLSVVYGIVNGHEGLIRVKSKIGDGTTFRILLPATDSVAPIKTKPKRPHMASGNGAQKCKGTILVADDEPIVRNLAVALLENVGWNVVTVDDGATALDWLRKNPNEARCFLLDVVMPNMGAPQVLDAIQTENIDIPIILMSGYSENQLEVYRENNRIVSVVAKPFRNSDLLKTIEMAVPDANSAERSTVQNREN